VYDCAIEENTMEYLKKCNFAHSPREERPGLGQNIWEFSDNNYDKSAAAARAMNDWFAELAQHGVPGDNILSDKVLYKIGHYSQMVWQSSYRLGCGVHSCPHMMFVACEYGPATEQPQQQVEEAHGQAAKETQKSMEQQKETLMNNQG
ncbi:SCP-like protein, partial [Teladorsagia circumcincta]